MSKADKIFDLLLQLGQIKLSPKHTIPSAREFKSNKYCKWHNSVSHGIYECKGFHQQIQSSIEQGRIKFENTAKPIRTSRYSAPANTVKVNNQDVNGKSKVFTSDRTRPTGAVDPEVQVSATELEGQRRCEQG